MSRRLNSTSFLLGVAAILAGCAGEASRRPMTYEERQEHFAEHKAELLTEFDLSNARVDTDDLFAPGIDRDGIPSLDAPARIAAADAAFPADDARVVEVVIDGDESTANAEGGINMAMPPTAMIGPMAMAGW